MLVLRWEPAPLRDGRARPQARPGRPRVRHEPEAHPRELEPLTASINAFIESERENLDRQRNTLADLAHSLKTPLAVMRTQLDSGAGERGCAPKRATQLRRMNDLSSYQLARATRSGHQLFAAPIEIEPHAEQIVTGLEKVYAGKRVLCEFEIAPQAASGEVGDLQELLGNLLEKRVQVGAGACPADHRRGTGSAGRRPGLSIAVEDDGPGIAEDRIARAAAWRTRRRARAGPWHWPRDRAGHRQELPR